MFQVFVSLFESNCCFFKAGISGYLTVFKILLRSYSFNLYLNFDEIKKWLLENLNFLLYDGLIVGVTQMCIIRFFHNCKESGRSLFPLT